MSEERQKFLYIGESLIELPEDTPVNIRELITVWANEIIEKYENDEAIKTEDYSDSYKELVGWTKHFTEERKFYWSLTDINHTNKECRITNNNDEEK